MLLYACAYAVKSEISLDTGDSASNDIVKRSVFINQRRAECVCSCSMDFVSAGKNTLYMTICEKFVPRLKKHNDVIEWDFMKIAPPQMKTWLRPRNQSRSINWFQFWFSPVRAHYCYELRRVTVNRVINSCSVTKVKTMRSCIQQFSKSGRFWCE